MSHVIAVQGVVVTNLDALERAAARLGGRLLRNQKTYRWWNRWVNDYHQPDAAYLQGIKVQDYGKCEHAIGLVNNPSAYEIGLVPYTDPATGQSGYRFVYDFIDSQLNRTFGQNLDTLMMHYQIEVGKLEAESRGYAYDELPQEDGSILLQVYA